MLSYQIQGYTSSDSNPPVAPAPMAYNVTPISQPVYETPSIYTDPSANVYATPVNTIPSAPTSVYSTPVNPVVYAVPGAGYNPSDVYVPPVSETPDSDTYKAPSVDSYPIPPINPVPYQPEVVQPIMGIPEQTTVAIPEQTANAVLPQVDSRYLPQQDRAPTSGEDVSIKLGSKSTTAYCDECGRNVLTKVDNSTQLGLFIIGFILFCFLGVLSVFLFVVAAVIPQKHYCSECKSYIGAKGEMVRMKISFVCNKNTISTNTPLMLEQH